MSDNAGQPTHTRKHARRGQVKEQKTRVTIAPDVLKERQQKLKEEREALREGLDGRHRFIIDVLADRFKMEYQEVEDALLTQDSLDQFENFFELTGTSHLLFFYEPPGEGEGRKARPRILMTSGQEHAYTGLCAFFTKSGPRALSNANIAGEVNFGTLESPADGMLGAIEELLSSLFIPALHRQLNWGRMDDAELRLDFLSRLENFVNVLSNAKLSLSDSIRFSRCEVDLSGLFTATDFLMAAATPELLEPTETQARLWCEEIHQILTVSEQMRQEADCVGPRAELDHWKKRLARFSSLTESLRSQECKSVVSLLIASKSKVLKTWRELDARITDCTNEAKDNVKYLYTLERYCEPLYKGAPGGMEECLPGLMNAVRMINSYSRYYNTPERMTALFVKVTNQMITACRSHITEDARVKVSAPLIREYPWYTVSLGVGAGAARGATENGRVSPS